jgi:hypothetical protein
VKGEEIEVFEIADESTSATVTLFRPAVAEPNNNHSRDEKNDHMNALTESEKER